MVSGLCHLDLYLYQLLNGLKPLNFTRNTFAIWPFWAKIHWYIKYEEIGNNKLPVPDKLLKYEGKADAVRFMFCSSKKRNKKNRLHVTVS
jgi:hypothetical protein